MLRYNYFKKNGKRSSITLSESDIKALGFILKKKKVTGTDVKEYVAKKITSSKARKNSFSCWIHECIVFDLLKIAKGE